MTAGSRGFDVVEATIGELHEAMHTGTVSAESLVGRYLDRIAAYDDELRSIITVNPNAVERAIELDTAFERDGLVGPLHGVPVVLKDNHETHDLPTSVGCAALADLHTGRDATVVRRFREAGAIVLAKANLHEFAYGVETISSRGGETRNPYALTHRPSGSSGGTAAAIAANLGMVGTGTDTCSSVRSPPAFTSLVGLRPTRGLVSRAGIAPLSDTQDTVGPITRTVEDAARILDVMVGFDPADPVSALGAGTAPRDGYVPSLDANALHGARIGIVRSFFGLQDPSSAPKSAAAAVTDVLETAIAEMRTAGATVVDPVPIVDRTTLEAARVIEFEFKRDFERYLAELGGAAPFRSLEAIIETGCVVGPVEERIRAGGVLDADPADLGQDSAYLRRLHDHFELRVDTIKRLVEYDLDALLYPPSTIPPVTRPETQPFSELLCELAAHTGLPAIVVPAGFTADGLPVGLELLGRPFGEDRLFELAYAYEQASRKRRPPADFGALK